MPPFGAGRAVKSITPASRIAAIRFIIAARSSLAVASSLKRTGLFGSPASFTADNRGCRYGATFSANRHRIPIRRIDDLWLEPALLRRYGPHIKVPHAFFHHKQAVEKFLLVTKKAARDHCFLGLAQDRRAVFGRAARPRGRQV
jgi:hypothetical protein